MVSKAEGSSRTEPVGKGGNTADPLVEVASS